MKERQPQRPRRSTLAVPGSSTKMIEKAAALTVDQVLLDLEDAVAVDAKAEARGTVINALNDIEWSRHMFTHILKSTLNFSVN